MAITAGCSVFTPAESLAVGFIGGAITILAEILLEKIQIDDPVGATSVHMFPSIWGVLAVGLFGSNAYGALGSHTGVFKGGGFYLLGVQMLGVGTLVSWNMATSYLVFKTIHMTMGLRMEEKDEILGADWVEHKVRSEKIASRLEKAILSLNVEGEQQETEIAEKVSLEWCTYITCINPGTLPLQRIISYSQTL